MTYTPNLSKITKEEIVTLPVESFPGHIVVVDRPEEVGQAVRILSASRCVGFDTETRPSFKKISITKSHLCNSRPKMSAIFSGLIIWEASLNH